MATKAKPKPKRKPAKPAAATARAKPKPKVKKTGAKPATQPAAPVPPPAPPAPPSSYEARKERSRLSQSTQSQRGRDIGPIPDIENPARREACKYDLRLFFQTYNPGAFALEMSKNQLHEIKMMQETVLHGALFAFGDPRGDGKTTRCRMAVLWAVGYAHRRFAVLIGANDGKAADNLAAVKTYIRFLPRFAADFPEVSFAARRLGGIANRASGQLCQGEPTLIEWSQSRIILPTVPPPANWPAAWPLRADGMAPTSGVIVSATGLTADGIRGSLFTDESGESVRPDLVLIDDPQTPDSAKSPTGNETRERLISADVLGMAGPGKTIAAFMPATVICPGDCVDRILNKELHPLWRGERTAILTAMPKNLDAWERYFETYRRCAVKSPPDYAECNAEYIANRAVLDEGTEATWPARKLPTEVSAIQHAMHLYCRDPNAFMAEYMNDPRKKSQASVCVQLEEKHLRAKLNNLPRGVVPRECSRLTAFFDIQAEVFFWIVCGWTEKFGGAVVDYGAFPEQGVSLFKADAPFKKLSALYPAMERGARIYSGLAAAVPGVIGRRFAQDGSKETLGVEQCLIDCGFETKTIHDFISRSPLRPLLKPSKGKGLGPAKKPMAEYRNATGDKSGENWRIDANPGGHGRFVSFDTYPWKSFVAESILAPAGATTAFYLCGTDLQKDHPLLTTHLLSEWRAATGNLTTGHRVEEWATRPDCKENHWWDGVVGCAVGASILGVKFSASVAAGAGPASPAAKKLTIKEIQEQRQREARERGQRYDVIT